ncbi:MAG TPA: putative PEP-binding protein [Aestuariivirga sp.]|nr:putative PEP-binding protein [Aestuariivirga sp.]
MARKTTVELGKCPPSLGPKAAGLSDLLALGLAVPRGFVIPDPAGIPAASLAAAVKKLGSKAKPLLLAVRPSVNGHSNGYMEAILNVGLNDETVEALAQHLNDRPLAYDLYRQFIQNYAVNVLSLRHADFEDIFSAHKGPDLISYYKSFIEKQSGAVFPQGLLEQLQGVVKAASRRKKSAALIVQAMIHGGSILGVATSRNFSTGVRDPNIAPAFVEKFPKQAAQLKSALNKIERRCKSIQEVTFTVENGKLWLLQTKPAKISARVELKTLVDMVGEGLLTKKEAVLRVDPLMLDQFLHPTLDATEPHDIFVSGLAASPGAVSGQVVFDAAEAQQLKTRNRPCILVRSETSPEDIQGMHAAEGVLTARGGLLSHAAVIARGMGKTCVVGASGLRIDYDAGTMTALGVVVKKGETITIDGSTGRVFRGRIATQKPVLSGDFATILEWADASRRMKVRANAETPNEARSARYFGAEGIGLCRTEHMFFSAERIGPMRKMILAETVEARREALDEILPMQRQDFIELFEIMAGLPVTIRLLDPPLHEFLPKSEHEILELAHELAIAPDYLRTRVGELQEFNPMLGHRGVRLAVSYPEIAEMQARAIFEATADVAKKYGKAPIPEIMIPLVVGKLEFDYVRARIDAVAEAVQQECGLELPYLVGTMIELPRATLRAGEIAESAEFFSFGTNDLTQTTLGISRDDSARFIGEYTAKGLLETDPFISLDIDGVGELLRIATTRGRKARPDLKLGICGEHAGDPASISFCEEIRLDYVSCSPFRIAIARLAAAQASIRNN